MTGRALKLSALAAALLLAGCERQIIEYRYRLTLEVLTPNGIKSGTSVITASARTSTICDGPKLNCLLADTTGKPAEVEVLPGRKLFANVGSMAFNGPIPHPKRRGAFDAHMKQLNAKLKAGGVWCIFLNGERYPPGFPVEKKAQLRCQTEKKGLPRAGAATLSFWIDEQDGGSGSRKQVDPSNVEQAFGKGIKLWRVLVQPLGGPAS